MESVGTFPCSELDSFMVSDFLGQSLFPGGHDEGFSPSLEAKTGVAAVSESLACSLNNPESSLGPVSEQCSYYSCDPTDGVSFHNVPALYLSGFNQIPANNHVFVPADMFMGIAGVHQENTADPYVAAVCSVVGAEGTGCVNNEGMCDHRATNFITADALALAKEMLLKRKCDAPEKNIVDSSENAGNKRIRVSRDVGSDGQSSCSYSSEDDNAGPETKPCMAMNSNGKTRAARGGATDPQSLYARKRRERINERLRILQNLVPNGTKVDISTMLEEAVHYVKFLQLQIKLLSSDDLWMYAPLAYNGIDMGLHQKIFSQLLRQ